MKSMRTLLLVLGLLAAPSPTPAGADDPPEADPPPALREGVTVDGALGAGEARSFPLELAEGDYVRGRFDGDRARLTLLRGDGGRERVLVAKGGKRLEFQFVAGDRPPYALEVRAEAAGAFAVSIESLVPRSAQVAPEEVPESPRLRVLRKTLAAGGDAEAFWHDVEEQSRGPLVERDGVSPPLAEGTSLVTFVWRGAKKGVRLFGAPSNDFDPLRRLGDSDVWYASYRVPNTARVAYKFAPDVPELDAPSMIRRRAILATAQRDPFNPKSVPPGELPDRYAGESLLELPDAPRPAWLNRRAEVPAGSIERLTLKSEVLGNSRDVHLYRPDGYRPGAEENALLVLFDGDRYIDDVRAPAILDNLIADRLIPPTAAVFVGNATAESRSAELPPNPAFARFLAEELTPWAKDRGVYAPATRTVVAGASYGGLAAAYAGWMHPDVFGNVYSQSGSFWWAPGASPKSGPAGGEEPEWLTRQVVDAPPRPVRFFLEAGTFEVGHGGAAGILDTTRHLRDVLKAKGYAVDYAEFAGAHGYAYWRFPLGDGLIRILGKPSSSARAGGAAP
jgi:enterochelin esterase family protein